MDGKKSRARFRRRAESSYRLVSRGFHWINEWPFNRGPGKQLNILDRSVSPRKRRLLQLDAAMEARLDCASSARTRKEAGVQLRMRHISSASFLFGLLCFFLPFITLSCPGANITFSGAQLATGTTVEVPQMFGGATQKKFDSEPLALFALLCALAGLAVGLSSAKGARTISAGLGILGAILLLALKAKISSDVAREGEGMLVVSYGLGYWLALISALFAAGFNFVLSRMRLTTVQQSPKAVSVDSVPDTINPSR